MNKTSLSSLIFIIYILIAFPVLAQVDSLRNYNLDEITVQSSILIEPKPLAKIALEKISDKDVYALNNIFRSVPSVKVQNNSRGESLIYFRGSGKRQLTLFFDGVPLNIPWDNRIDLSLLPTNALESIEVTKGIPSVVYGANSIAGIVNVFSLKPTLHNSGKINIQFGENNYQKYSGFWNGKVNKINFLFSLSYFKTNGFNLPSSFNNPENPTKLRVNSNIATLNGLLKLNYQYSNNSNSSIIVSLNNSEKGVPPEIDVAKPRYWKYPLWQRLSAIVNGTHRFANGSNLAYSFSAGKFNQEIDEYKSSYYTHINDIEKTKDVTFYGKLLYTTTANPNSIFKFVLSGLTSEHTEQIKSEGFEKVIYSQNIFSGGIEYEYVTDKFSTIIGASIDGQSTPETGKKPSKDMVSDVGGNITFAYQFTNNFRSQLSFGKKSRFPTLREQFSGALGRFILNPALKTETAYSTELNFTAKFFNSVNQLNFFLSYVKDGIVRISLPQKKFMRVNKSELRNFGIEYINKFELKNNLSTNFSFSYLNSFAKNGNGNFSDTLEYKPEFIFNANVVYYVLPNLELQLEANYIGKEYGLKAGSTGFQKLNDYLLLNFRIAYKPNFKNSNNIKLYFRVNNILNKLYYTQWGLPEAGRQFFIGTTIIF